MCNGIKIRLLEFEKRIQKQPKTTKKSHFWTFFNSLENPVRLKRKFLQPFYNTWGPMCAMTSRPYGLDWRNKAKIDQETANCELFNFFKVCCNDSNETSHSHFTLNGGPMCAMTSKLYG